MDEARHSVGVGAQGAERDSSLDSYVRYGTGVTYGARDTHCRVSVRS